MDNRLILSPEERCPISVLDDVAVVRLSLGEHVVPKTIKKRAKVVEGALVASHPEPDVGDLHAPISGVVKELTATFIEIEREAPAPAGEKAEAAPDDKAGKGGEAAEAKPVEPVSLDGLDAAALAGKLKELGVSTAPFTRPCELLIINGLNPEPGMLYAEELLFEHKPVLDAGLALARRLSGASRCVLVQSTACFISLEGADMRQVAPVYPASLTCPMIRAITGREDGSGVSVVRLHALFQLGLVARSGLPLTRTVTTAFGGNYLVPLGTPVSVLLERSAQTLASGDSLILGGAMRGVAIAGPNRGIRKEDDAVLLLKKNGRPSLEDNPCVSCGACVSACPMRLRPNMLSRYAEFERYEDCRKEYIDVCIECGMCGYVCPTCRPMQQLFRMAKASLGLPTYQRSLR